MTVRPTCRELLGTAGPYFEDGIVHLEQHEPRLSSKEVKIPPKVTHRSQGTRSVSAL